MNKRIKKKLRNRWYYKKYSNFRDYGKNQI